MAHHPATHILNTQSHKDTYQTYAQATDISAIILESLNNASYRDVFFLRCFRLPPKGVGYTNEVFRSLFDSRLIEPMNGEGKRRNEFVEWHVAWLAERHNYAEFNL